ncbi:hypothetical protein SLS64_013651 [Diaporthe eres]|uniref:Uncharacterized protein n=1 Tax=Diaporthe eres TaxID=83184 RepID=A0ABR1NML5_DIAER
MAVPALVLFTLVNALLARGEAGQSVAYMYLDDVEYMAASSNVVPMSLSTLEDAFVQTKPSDSSGFSGYDWTQPFPGEAIDGFDARLRIAYDVPVPDSVVQNSTSTVTALTFSNPPSMMGETNVTKPMDPSWFICQHLFVSDKPGTTGGIDHNCAWDATVLKDPAQADLLTVDQVSQYTWKIGTGYHDRGDPAAYGKASNRTYLVATVWGYGPDAPEDTRKVPDASFACLQPTLELKTPEEAATQAPKSSSSSSLGTTTGMGIATGLTIAALSST